MTLTLEESKGYCDRLTVLIGKYESNNTALQLAMNYSEQVLEAYEVLVNLLESEKGMLLANCRAAGLGSMGEWRTHLIRNDILNMPKHDFLIINIWFEVVGLN